MVTLADLGPIGLDSSSDGDVIDDFDIFSNPYLGSVSSGGETSAKKQRIQKSLNDSICSLAPSITIGTNKKPVKRKRPMKKKLKAANEKELKSTNENKAKLPKNWLYKLYCNKYMSMNLLKHETDSILVDRSPRYFQPRLTIWLKLMNRIFGIQKASTEISIFMKARASWMGQPGRIGCPWVPDEGKNIYKNHL